MFKVSFKEDECPSKVVEKVGKVTIVMYKGTVKLPKIWWYLPQEILKWIKYRDSLEIYENVANNTLIVYAKGKTKCADSDTYNSILGERIAEAKAKMVIYKFFANLCQRIYRYYEEILTGDKSLSVPLVNEGVAGDLLKYRKLYMIEKEHIKTLVENGNK